MKNKFYLLTIVLLFCFAKYSSAQIYSFEDGKVPRDWSISKGKLTVSDQRYKLGNQSLKITWQGKSVLALQSAQGLTEASQSSNGGIALWIYNESPIEGNLLFSFKNSEKEEVCNLPFSLNFTGWRCLWAKFREDMGMHAQASIQTVDIALPETKKGAIYFDYVEFQKTVSWQKMSDAQYKTNQKDYSLIHDFIGYRNTTPDLSAIKASPENQIGIEEINKRLTAWYLGNGSEGESPLVKIRRQEEKKYIQKGLKAGDKIQIKYNKDNTPVGEGLFPLYAPATIENEKVNSFPNINKNVLIPLALDYRKNSNKQSLKKALFIYDWFNDQGWADGSGMGTLCFEKLRSSGYFHSFFLLKNELTPAQLERELKAMKWFTMFGACYQEPEHAGEVADNLRALALPKLIYALSLTDETERQAAMSAYTAYMNNALDFGPGYFGTIKSDYSGYHHRGPYNSAYYPHALYAASLIAYLLHDTPYALSETSMEHLKQALLTYRFFSANLDVPAGTTGRFPKQQEILQILLPAYVYVALAQKEADEELTAAFKRILNNNPQQAEAYAAEVNSNLTYTSSVGEMELVAQLSKTNIAAEGAQEGALFMPYSGLMVIKSKNHHFNLKGFSKYIWDYESGSNENLYGRYLSFGQVEYLGLANGACSFHAAHPLFNWSHISGTTSLVLPKEVLDDKVASRQFHRNFSDESFLCGVGTDKELALFSLKLHDTTFEPTFRACKSVFAFNNALLCMGSGIENRDSKHTTATTLFQSLDKQKVAMEKTAEGVVLSADGLDYAVCGNTVQLETSEAFQTCYIDHGKAPRNDTYLYYIVYDGDRQQAKQLLSDESPVRIIEQSKDAHIIKHTSNKATYAALFNAEKEYEALPVSRVNIPLSYIFQEKGEQQFTLLFCEPDMRRPTGVNMGKLSEADVIQEEKPFDTELTLPGVYEVGESASPVRVRYEEENTILRVSTIRGENHVIQLIKK